MGIHANTIHALKTHIDMKTRIRIFAHLIFISRYYGYPTEVESSNWFYRDM